MPFYSLYSRNDSYPFIYMNINLIIYIINSQHGLKKFMCMMLNWILELRSIRIFTQWVEGALMYNIKLDFSITLGAFT